jgi:FkbM family methyltransferase
VDVGAWRGYYSYVAARNFTKILAFEPHPNNRSRIDYWIKHEGIKNVRVYPYAVSNRKGVAKLGTAIAPTLQHDNSTFSILPEYVSWSGGLVRERRLKTDRNLTVKTVTMKNVISTTGPVDLVKVDVEGAEWLVLEGAEPVMESIKSWIIELHDLRQKMKLWSYMTAFNYSCAWLDNNHLYCERRTDHRRGFSRTFKLHAPTNV